MGFSLDDSRDEESGAAAGSESRLHPAGVLAVRHGGREQQRPVVVSAADVRGCACNFKPRNLAEKTPLCFAVLCGHGGYRIPRSMQM